MAVTQQPSGRISSSIDPEVVVTEDIIVIEKPQGLEILSLLNTLFVRQEKDIAQEENIALSEREGEPDRLVERNEKETAGNCRELRVEDVLEPAGLSSLCSLLFGCEMKNRYIVYNSQMEQVFYTFEASGMCHQIWCGPKRGFTFHIEDNDEREVMTLVREFKCCAGCLCCADGCCIYPVRILDGERNQIGVMRTVQSKCVSHFGIFAPSGELIYRIPGVCCPCQTPCCSENLDFPVYDAKDGLPVATIAKEYSGLIREFCTNADAFKVTFPMDMHTTDKALIFAAVFLIDMTVFENEN